jgi:hypothetical protein
MPMGSYLNQDNEGFQIALQSEIYVDKTEMIADINRLVGTEQRFVCVSRPRRFGKSITANMLAAYYSKGCDSRALFEPLKIASSSEFEEHLNQYDVIYLDMQLILARSKSFQNFISYLESRVLLDLQKYYSPLMSPNESSLSDAIDMIYSSEGYRSKGFIFIVDEWDCIFREAKGNKEAQKEYLDFLKGVWKGQRCVKLVYMTGILPIKKYGTHSALNIFEEYSMTDPSPLEQYVGFTEEEVKKLCEKYQMEFDEIKRWYDGYHFPNALHIYNPKSVVSAMLRKSYKSYWTRTETYEALKIYIDMNFDGLKEDIVSLLGGENRKINISKFENDMTTFHSKDDILTLLIHLGYLAYDTQRKETFIPNFEIREEFVNAMEDGGWSEVIKSIRLSEELLDATLQMDTKAVAAGIDVIHQEVTSILNYNNENALSCVIHLAYYSARQTYTLIREFPTGKGFADVVFLPRKHTDKPALVVELKWDKTAEGAIRQIKEKEYGKVLENYVGEVLLVGINYDKESKKHTCLIERAERI